LARILLLLAGLVLPAALLLLTGLLLSGILLTRIVLLLLRLLVLILIGHVFSPAAPANQRENRQVVPEKSI